MISDMFRRVPVSVNCFYGDPTLQWGDTLSKLRDLEKTGHTGPVSIITKGSIGPARAKELAALSLPGLLVIVSISELPEEIEGVGHEHRYRTLASLREAGVRCFAAVRPITPPYNTSEEVIERIFQRLQAVGCETACVSGFRGNDALIETMKPAEILQWSLRVKQMTGFDNILSIARQHGVQVFTRVACAVSALLGRKGTYNPYWGSPQLVRCKEIECPLQTTCGPVEPDPDMVDWLINRNFDLVVEEGERACCSFSSDNRLSCKSCCTTCWVQRQPRVIVRNARTLGDLTFVRFALGGTLATRHGMVDGGETNVGQVSILQERTGLNIQCINSWFVYATTLDHCFDCKYCIASIYPNNGVVGFPPALLEELV